MTTEMEANNYLIKPFSRSELLEYNSSRVNRLLEHETYLKQKIAEIEKKVTDRLDAFQKEIEEKTKSISDISIKNEQLGKQLKEKEMELMKETLNAIETNNTLQDLRRILRKELQNPRLPAESKKILSELKDKTNKKTILWNNCTTFQMKFNQVYPAFVSNITKRFSGLTRYEIVFISAHLMGLGTNQLADLLNISDDSVRKSRYRLKKKLGLRKTDDFLKFIHTLNTESDIVIS